MGVLLPGHSQVVPPAQGDLERAAELRLEEHEDTGLDQWTQLPHLLGTFKTSLQRPRKLQVHCTSLQNGFVSTGVQVDKFNRTCRPSPVFVLLYNDYCKEEPELPQHHHMSALAPLGHMDG